MILKNAFAFGLCLLSAGAQAGVISYQKVTNDADSGISAANTYTHAIDFQTNNNGGLPATINGVAFVGQGGNGNGFTRTVANGGSNNNNGSGIVTTSGNLADLMQGFLFNNEPARDGSGLQTYTITGLTAGTEYDLRIYSHLWTTASRVNTLIFDPSGAADSTGPIDQDDSSTVGFNETDSYYLNYRYTATGTSLTWTAANAVGSNASYHLYGLTNQVVPNAIPEPASLLVGAIGLGGLVARRRRRA